MNAAPIRLARFHLALGKRSLGMRNRTRTIGNHRFDAGIVEGFRLRGGRGASARYSTSQEKTLVANKPDSSAIHSEFIAVCFTSG